MKKLLAVVVSVALMGVAGVNVAEVAAATPTLPRGDFPQCSDTVKTYCISSVTLVERGVDTVAKWVAKGVPVVGSDKVANTKTYTTFGTTATTYAGRWSYDGFPAATRAYDGVYVKAAPANEFTDSLMLSVEPAGPNDKGDVGRVKDSTTNRVVSLDADSGVRVVVRLGELTPAVTMAMADNAVVDIALDGTTPVVTFEGTPIGIAQAASTKDCDSETSVAVAKPNQAYFFMAFANGRDPYGVPGLSGRMLINSNGPCKLSTPVWNASTKEMEFTASAPHFAPDGATVNSGLYRAVIPAEDALLLWGISNDTDLADAELPEDEFDNEMLDEEAAENEADVEAAAVGGRVSKFGYFAASKTMTIEVVESDGGESKAAQTNVAFDGDNFIVTATGFSYSTTKLRMKQGLARNAPAPVKKATVRPGKGTITATFSAGKSTRYVVLARSKTVTKPLVCKTKKTTVTCVVKRLKKGTWSVAIYPTNRGLVGKKLTKSVRVP
ncbi:MAG: hypothetical protein FJ284_11545 [Planctomycetes bacterium]|nr:hypothetical protein [Planctomycetota bacterium]